MSAVQPVIVLSAQDIPPSRRRPLESARVLPKRALLIKAVRFRACGLCSSTPFGWPGGQFVTAALTRRDLEAVVEQEFRGTGVGLRSFTEPALLIPADEGPAPVP